MMTRRGFLGVVPVIAAAASAPITNGEPRKYGAIDPQTHWSHLRRTGEFLRVWLDGEDVTSGCSYADDREGFVDLSVKTEADFEHWQAKGGYYIDYWKVRVAGDVVIKPGHPL